MLRDLTSSGSLKKSSFFKKKRSFSHQNTVCRESAGTGPVNLKVVPNGCFLGRLPWTIEYAPLYPTTTIGMK